MANHTVKAHQLTERSTILVLGQVSYSRIASPIEGEEMARRNEGRMYPKQRPYTALTVKNASVAPVSGNADQLSTEEIFVQERHYVSRKYPENNLMYSAESPYLAGDGDNSTLPQVWEQIDGKPGEYRQLEKLDGELATDLNVILVLEVYKSRGQENRGLALRAVLAQEPVRYQSSGINVSALAQRGIILTGTPKAMAAPAGSDAGSEGLAPGTEVSQGLAMPAPQTAQSPAVQVQPNPIHTPTQQQPVYQQPAQQVQQPVYQQPQQQPAPAAQGTFQPQAGSAFGGAPQAPNPEVEDVWAPAPQGPGVTFQG